MSEKIEIVWATKAEKIRICEIDESEYGVFCLNMDDMDFITSKDNILFKVAIIDNKIVGYMMYQIYKTAIKVHRLVVLSEYRRKGIGSLFIDGLKSKLTSDAVDGNRRYKIVFPVRETEVGGQLFLKKLGFKTKSGKGSSIIKRYFETENLDAYIMEFYSCHDNSEKIYEPIRESTEIRR